MAKDLDDELAELVGHDDDDDGMAVAAPSTAATDAGPRKKGSVGLLAMLLVMMSGIVALFVFGFNEAAVYSMPLEKYFATASEHEGRRVRIEGELVPGTLSKRDKPCEYRFSVRSVGEPESEKLAVRFPQCVIPDTFRDMPEGGVLVTVEGTAEGDYFQATNIMAKCSSKYDAETHELEVPGGQKKQRPEGADPVSFEPSE